MFLLKKLCWLAVALFPIIFEILKLLTRQDLILTHLCAKQTVLPIGGMASHYIWNCETVDQTRFELTHLCAKHTVLASGGIVPHQHSKVSKYKTSQVFSAWPKVSTTKSQNRERHHSRGVNGRVISVPNWTKKGNFLPFHIFPNKNWMNTSYGVLVIFRLKYVNLL